MPDGSVDPKIFETLSEKLDLLAKNIEYLYEASNRIANRDERRGVGNDLPYIMNFDNIRDDIFRSRGLRYYNESSDTERENYRNNLENERETNRQDRRDAINKNRENRKQLDELRDERTSLKDKKRQQKNELKSLEAKHRRGEISDDEYTQKRTEVEKDLNETLKELVENLKKRQTKSSDISKTDSRIQTAKDNIVDIDNKLNNIEASFNNDVDEKRNSIINQAWSGMTDKERARYNNNITQFAEAKSAQHEYNERNDERQEVSRMVQNSGLENTAFGRITQNAINRNQKFDNIQNFGRQLSKEGGAARLSKQLFGAGKGASFATKAFSGLGGIMGKFGKLMGGPVVGGILMAIDAIKALGKAIYDGVNEWAAVNAEFVKYQTEQEKIQYEKAKQFMVIDTQTEIEKITLAGDLAVKHTEMMSQNFLEGLSIQNDAFVKSMEIGTGAMTMGVAQTAYSAAEASIDQAAKMRKYEVHQGQRASSFGLYQTQRELQAEGKIAGLAAEKQVAEVQANVETLRSAQNLNESLLDRANKAGFSGSGAVNAISAYRNAAENTTTGVSGEGNINPMTGTATSVDDHRDKIKEMESAIGKEMHGKTSSFIGAALGGDRHGFSAENNALAENYMQKMSLGVDAMKTKTELYYNKATTQMEYQTQLSQQVVDTTAQAKEAVIDAATAVEKNWLKTTQVMEEWLRKYDERMNDVGLNVGMWTKQSLSAFKEGHLETVKEIARKYGKSEEQIAQYQNAFTETSGRNKLLSGGDIEATARLGITSGSDEMAAKYISEMEIFNKSATDSADLMNEEMRNINKLGLNARKYMKDVTNNLKLAQKYNFKEGTKSLREMVKWAQQTKFNMESLGGMLEKVQEGGIEGVIQQSAGFQVLGGMAAINSDPLGMLYDAWADPQAYAKRMQDMTKGFGTFNRKTGETEFNMPESMQIAQIAKLQGRSAEEVRQEIIRRNQTEEIKKVIRPEQNLNKDQIQFLSNSASYDQESGQWKVNMLNKDTGEIERMDLSDINSKNIENYAAVSENHDEKMETLVEELVSLVARERGEQAYELADQAAMDYKNTMQNLNDRLEKIHESYINQRMNIYAEIVKKQEEIRDSTTNFLEQFATNIDDDTSSIAKETAKIREKTDAIGEALGAIAQTVNAANDAINQTIAEKMGQFSGSVEASTNNANQRVSANKPQQYSSSDAVSENEVNAKKVWKRYRSAFGHDIGDVENRVKDIMEIYNDPQTKNDKNAYKKVMSAGWHDLLDAMESSGVSKSDNFDDISLADIHNLAKYAETTLKEIKSGEKNYKTNTNTTTYIGTTRDAVTHSNNTPMTVAASDITPINDGSVTLAQTHPEDTGIFAKTGGPFDKLFEGVFGKISAVYDTLKEERRHGNWQEISQIPMEKYGNLPKSSNYEIEQDTYRNRSENYGNNKKDVNVNINGRLTLDSGGQSVDVIGLLRDNPDIVRKITETIILQMSNNENGGKHDMFSNRFYR